MSQNGSRIERIGKKKTAPRERPKRFLTGIRSLDMRLGMEFSREKGIPDGTLIIVRTDSNANIPRLLTQRILLNFAKDDQAAVFYVHSSRPLNLVKRDFEAFDWHVEEYENRTMFFEDMYGMGAQGSASAIKVGPIAVKRKTFLKQIYAKMYKVKEEHNKWCFSIVDDLLWIKEDQLDEDYALLIQFLKEVGSRILAIGGVHFMLLPRGILSPIAEQILMSYSSAVFEFERKRVGSRLKDHLTITKLLGVAYVPDAMDIIPHEEEGFRLESISKV